MTEYRVQVWIESVSDGEGPWIPEVDDNLIVDAKSFATEGGWVKFRQKFGDEWSVVLAIPEKFVRQIEEVGAVDTYRDLRRRRKKARKQAYKEWCEVHQPFVSDGV